VHRLALKECAGHVNEGQAAGCAYEKRAPASSESLHSCIRRPRIASSIEAVLCVP